MKSLILASDSPRRRELLMALGLQFGVRPSHVDEALRGELPIGAAIEEVALRKARGAAGGSGRSSWVLAADTAVVVGNEALGKPDGPAEAARMLRLLSGTTHRVITGVALVGPDHSSSFHVSTEVDFRALSEAEIGWYTSLDEPYDKAGAYAVQGRGAFMVAAIRGSYTNVVGLPMSETLDLLERMGLVPWCPETHGPVYHAG